MRLEAIKFAQRLIRARKPRIALNDVAANARTNAAQLPPATRWTRIPGPQSSSYRFMENCFRPEPWLKCLRWRPFGLAITFGVMGVINMAHGEELIMLGAYTTWGVQVLFPNLIDVEPCDCDTGGLS